jgi:hypothetical protein
MRSGVSLAGIVSAAVLLMLTGCTQGGVGASQPGHSLTIADEKMVANCRFVGDVTGVSSMYGLFAPTGLANARDEALKEAVRLNASHVVWTGQSVVYGSTSINGRAYQCGG